MADVADVQFEQRKCDDAGDQYERGEQTEAPRVA